MRYEYPHRMARGDLLEMLKAFGVVTLCAPVVWMVLVLSGFGLGRSLSGLEVGATALFHIPFYWMYAQVLRDAFKLWRSRRADRTLLVVGFALSVGGGLTFVSLMAVLIFKLGTPQPGPDWKHVLVVSQAMTSVTVGFGLYSYSSLLALYRRTLRLLGRGASGNGREEPTILNEKERVKLEFIAGQLHLMQVRIVLPVGVIFVALGVLYYSYVAGLEILSGIMMVVAVGLSGTLMLVVNRYERSIEYDRDKLADKFGLTKSQANGTQFRR